MFVDTFPYNVANILEKWSSKSGTMSINATAGRRSKPALRVGNANNHWIRKSFAAKEYASIATAVSVPTGYAFTGGVPTTVMAVWGANAMHLFLELTSAGQLKLYRADYTDYANIVLLGSSSAGVVPVDGTWKHIELSARIHATLGSANVWVGGVETPVISLSSIRTQSAANWAAETAQGLGFGGHRKADVRDYPAYWDTKCGLDYCDVGLDWSTSAIAQKGDCRADLCLLTADGTPQDWTPSAGNAFEVLNANGAEYVSGAADEATSLFAFQDITHDTPLIHGIQVCSRMSIPEAGVREITGICKGSSTIAEGSALALSTNAIVSTDFFGSNPDGGAWTKTALNNALIGIRVKT